MSSLLNQIFRKKKHSQYANSQKSMEILLAPGCTTTSNSNSARTLQTINPINPEDLQDLQSFSIKASSVFNTPMKKASFLQNLYGKFEDIGDYIHNPESAKLPFNTAEITVEDFKAYLTKLRASHESYLKDKAHASQESLEKEEITDITGSLMQCYRKVPQQYFDPQFHFNFTWLQHENEDIAKYHIDLSETLGMVEKNLYYQISTKFSTILNTIQDLTDQENRINKSLEAIKNIRTVNHKLKESNSGKIFEVMKLKRKQLNLQRTLQVLDMMNLVKKIVPTLKLLIQRGNFDHAVNLLNSSEQTLSQKLGSIKCLQICNSGFQQARTTLQQMLMSEFETRCLDYFSKCLSYTKAAAKEQGEQEEEEEERDDLQSRRLKKDLYVDSLNKELLDWTLEDVGENSTIADQMSKIILAHIKLKEVSLSSFRPQLNDLFKKFHKQFTTDMSEHLAGLNQRIENPQERAAMAFDLKVEFMTFYFRAYKRFFINFSEVNNKILSKVINYFDSKLIADPDSKESHAANANAVKILTHTAQEFYSIFTVVVRNFNDKMAQVIQQVEINNASASQFLAFEEAFDELVCFFKEKFDFQEKLYSSITTPKESLKKTLMKTISSFLDQMSISAVTSLRLLSEKQFIQTFFARKKDDLIKKLKQEKWQAVDVPFDQLENLRLLFDHSEVAKNSNSSPIVSASTEASEVNSARIKDIQEDEPPSPLMEIEKKHPLTVQSSVISIKKKTATINGKKYKLSESFLEIAQSIAELYSLSQKFSSIREESISKMMSLVKIFSSTIDYDILKGNATSGAKGGVITPEILAFGASSLVLLEQAIGILKARYEKSHEGLSDVLENETKQVTSELENLNSKLLLKISEILRDVVLVDRCAKLKTVRWQDSQEKASVPTQHSSQIIDKIGSVYKKISVYLPQENLAAAFRVVLGDIGKYYVPIFEEFDVANGLSAKRIKGELCYFVDSLKRIEIFGDFETDLLEFEERISTITDHKCGPFIELASLDEENEVEAG